jgi:hypothetical protein
MESDPLNQAAPEDPGLEHLLRTRLAAPPLDDAGFSSRVLQALPSPARQATGRRTVVLILGAVLGLVIGFGSSPATVMEIWGELVRTACNPGAWSEVSGEAYLKILLAAMGAWWVFREELRTLIDV